MRLLQPQVVEQVDDVQGHPLAVACGVVGLTAHAVAALVDGDDLELLGESADDAGGAPV